MNQYIIVHEEGGSPFENWIPWLEQRLKEDGKEVIVPQFPTQNVQCYKNWEKVLSTYQELGYIDENTIFIGHSLAPVFICKYLIYNQIKVKGLIAISGFNKLLGLELDKVNETFLMEEEELKRINEYFKFAFCFYSNNDPYVKKEIFEQFADCIKAEKYYIEDGGHFDTKSGYTKFPQITEVIQQAEGELSFFEEKDMPIGVNAIILNEEGKILLGRRINRFGEGTYGLIGGKLKQRETLEQGIIRELKEEVGIKVNEKDIEVINLANTVDAKNHFIQIGILVKQYQGIPKILEPNKCDDLQFFDLDHLPELFPITKTNIELYRNHSFYDKKENIWEEKNENFNC